jgi:excinuclease ABC subunit C
MKFRYLDKNKINSLPKTAGVYCFSDKQSFLYIGKAGNIKNRVKNHFSQPTYKDEMFLGKVKKIGYIKTESEIQALILESELIKKHKPKYNTLWKDDKNYFYVAIADNGYVFLTHQLQTKNYKLPTNYIGPFVDGKAIKQTLKMLRRTFPYYTQRKHPKGLCPWCHLNLCPGPKPDLKKHKKNINGLKAVLKGKSQRVIKEFKKEMKKAARQRNFEKAAELRDKIFSLEKVLRNSKIISNNLVPRSGAWDWLGKKISKIEAYDISNIQGQLATGSMVVFINGKPEKDLYRKFKIKISGKPNDTAMIKEVLKRRIRHKEWPLPDLFLIDGGKPQLSTAKQVIKKIPVAALAKKHNELFIDKKPLLLKNMPRDFSNLILQLRDEAHRFAITYHKKLREIDLGLKS